MRKTVAILSIVITMLLLTSSCSKEQSRCTTCPEEELYAEDYIVFKSNIRIGDSEMRSTPEQFDVSDQIGVYVRGVEERNNLHYHAISGGRIAVFYPTASTDRIYPSTTRQLDFYAYAPYFSSVSNANIHINLLKDPIDLLWAHLRELSPRADKKEYTLLFGHILSQLIFTLRGLPAGVTLRSMDLKGVVVEGDFDLLTGEMITSSTSLETLPLMLNPDKSSASTLMLPAEVYNLQLSMTLSNGQTYTYPIDKLSIASGHIYYYNVNFGEGGITVDLVNGQINEWSDGDTINISLEPSDDGGSTPTPVGENIYSVDLTQEARTLPLNDDFSQGGKAYDPFTLPGWLNKAIIGSRTYEKRDFSDVHYAQATAYNSQDPENQIVLVTPRLQMTAGDHYTVYLTYSSGHTNGATLTVQQLDKDGVLVKDLELINDMSSPDGYGNQHYIKSYTITATPEAGYIAFIYKGSQTPLHTTTYQIEAVEVR